ncbi:sulfatase [Paenibacillus sp. IB182496]|uniref:Sulfatase n=1 Tax=Paenibacillus sabuli TaxID=2772509 RepID=A0A927GQM3_9BACL|nr:sulfatase [Paenibacillus sabuli]MBD2843917.1 sulfatase [Paenibacillus sabuli]
MKAIMIMFDTLNRRMLPPYGCDWTQLPNFSRLASRTAVFDRCYVGSMPCMPARRELHTGRYNFLHRSWGPLEPFDDSLPELLRRQGVYTHLATDHQHYWEDGGATYHTRYDSFELIRGQEGDPWRGIAGEIELPQQVMRGGEGDRMYRQDWINRQAIREEADFPQARTFEAGLSFIETNRARDDWFLQLETFDPHEPFHAPERYRQLYPHIYDGQPFDWPTYTRTSQTRGEIEHLRCEYAALLSMCDAYLGRVLDLMDRHGLWEDTMLIVNTDHGFLLGEHDWWAKCVQPFYQEVAHIPLFIWDPRSGARGVRRDSLVQTIDLAPTLLEYFGAEVPPDMTGYALRETIAADAPVREAALFGIHGGHVNCTDGTYVYMLAPVRADRGPLSNYTLMPTHMRSRFAVEELRGAELSRPFAFTKGVPLLRVPVSAPSRDVQDCETMLFDVSRDPEQLQPLRDPAVEARLREAIIGLMRQHDAPAEQYERLGLTCQSRR